MDASTPVITTLAPALVLDTNVVLDWLVFRDPVVAPIVAALQARRLTWLVCPAMQGELQCVLSRDTFTVRGVDAAAVLDEAARHWAPVPDPSPIPPGHSLHSTDPDDQVFMDLAWHARAGWLITRDRALLRLARKAAQRGVWIGTPARWTSPACAAT